MTFVMKFELTIAMNVHADLSETERFSIIN